MERCTSTTLVANMSKLQLVSKNDLSPKQLEKSQSCLYKLVKEHSHTAFAELSPAGVLIHSNSAFCKLIGYDANWLNKVALANLCHSQELKLIDKTLKEFENGSTSHVVIELRFNHRQGHTLWGLVDLSRAESHNNKQSILVQVSDITKYKEENAKLLASEQELSQYGERVIEDLRNPLAAILKVNEIVNAELDKNNFRTAKHFTELSEKTLHKLTNLVNGVICVNYIRRHKDAAKVPISPDALVRECLAKLAKIPEALDIKIISNFQFEQLFLGNHIVLTNAIDHLITNAVKFKDPSKHTSFIKVATFKEEDNLCIEVSDNGLGINKEYRKSIFKMFSRFHPSVSDGAGLGLYSVKKCATHLGGTVDFRPLNNESGCVFTLKVPCQQDFPV